MFKSALRYIRQKPKAVRNQYALALSSLFTAVVFFIWLASGTSSLDKTSSSLKATEVSTPFSNLIKQAKEQFASSKVALTKAEQATSSSTASTTSGEMILSPETLEGVEQTNWSTSTATTTNFGFSANSKATTSTSTFQYIEVQIATTSSQATPTTTTQ